MAKPWYMDGAKMETRRVNPAGVELVKRFEGLRLFAYLCPAGVWTIGYGHTGADVRPKQQITQERAEMLLDMDLDEAAAAVAKHVTVPLSDNQFAALASFVFNLGEGAFKKSTLLRRLNDGNYRAVPEELAKWNKITQNGQKVPSMGLTKRRKAEAALWEQK